MARGVKGVVAHGGGPTAVINASLAGLVQAHQRSGDTLFGAVGGIAGLLDARFTELTTLGGDGLWDEIAQAPGSALGSSRRPLAEGDCERMVEQFRRLDVRRFFYTGGNGSMGTALRIEHCARELGYELQVIGIPKTIDNDLLVTDHSPGYGSTARFFACAARDAGEDNRSLPSPICILEVLGRNAGWIAAATALARHAEDDAPHVILLPERRLSLDAIAAEVERVYRRLGRAFVVVCEGQRDEQGLTFGAHVDRPGSPVHELASNLGHTLALALTAKLGIRARAEKPGLVGRSCGLFASLADRQSAYRCGAGAARAAAIGESAVMVALRRECDDPYETSVFTVALGEVAGRERLLPEPWIAEGGMDVTREFLEYARPLTGPVPAWKRLPGISE